MSAFWIFGIILNATLTGLILFWLIRQAKPGDSGRERAPEDAKEKDSE